MLAAQIVRVCFSFGFFENCNNLLFGEYLKFVEFNLKYVVNRKAYRALKKKQVVNVPFSL